MSLFNEQPKIGQELLDVPMGDMIRQMAFAIAEAQIKLDSNSMEVAQMMGGLKTITTEINGEDVITFEDSRVFFGQEKLTLAGSIDLYNSTNDKELKATILNKLTNTDYEIDSKIVIDSGQAISYLTNTTNTIVTVASKNYNLEDKNLIFKVTGSKYFVYDSRSADGTARTYRELQSFELPIVKKSTATEKTFFIPARVSMLELGFSPTFYQFIDTIIEVKISIKYTQEGSYTRNTNTSNKSTSARAGLRLFPGFGGGFSAGSSVTTSQVNASYSQKYSYSAEGSSLLRTKLVPTPPPAILEERIRAQMELAKEQNKTT